MEKGIEFDVLGIAEAIKRNRLTVPPNQREYSWLSEFQVKDLLQDISGALRNPGQPYFLGTVVLTKNNHGELEIADGQQRLATTTMIMAAIRDWFRSKGDTMIVQSIENDFLFTIDRKKRETVPRISLNTDDNEYFKNIILEPKQRKTKQLEVRRSHKLISSAFEVITKFIQGIELQAGDKNTKEILNDWMEYLQHNANIVMLVVANAENAFMMFETLNDRGLKTSQVDLVKNHIFKISDNRLSEAQGYWSKMKGAIESVSDDTDDITIEFLRSVCCIISGLTTKKEVMKKIQDKTQNKTEAIQILVLFEELSKDYAAILNPDHQKWNNYDQSIRNSIQVMNLFGVTAIRPLMLAVAKYFNEKNTASSFKKFVSWSVRFLILGVRGGRLDEGYSKLAKKIYDKEIKTVDELSKEAEKLVVGDAEFKEGFEIAKVGTAKLARYYLRSLEKTARGEENPEFIPNDSTVINIEHIMPENFGSNWPKLAKTDIETHLTRMGNLALMQAKKNSNVGNMSFNEKKKVYKESSFLLTNEISNTGKWGKEEIEARQKTLAAIAVTTWPL
jgi:uncharacterized protein with ParB-like and HNH nuclease domain